MSLYAKNGKNCDQNEWGELKTETALIFSPNNTYIHEISSKK